MPEPTYVPVNPKLVEWAIEESGHDIGEIAERLKVPSRVVTEWIKGESYPTKTQFGRLAEVVRKPTALFFLPKPPPPLTPPVKFRAATGKARDLEPDERAAMVSARRLQLLLRWLAERRGTPPIRLSPNGVVGTPEETANQVRKQLNVPIEHQLGWETPAQALREWRRAVERLGVVVIQEELGRSGVRGFSLRDEYAPLIEINQSYLAVARIFSLFHEFGHLLAQDDSACLGFVRPSHGVDPEERWCEQFAAAVLLPSEPLGKFLEVRYGSSRVSGIEPVRAVSSAFKVSARATALRLIGLDWAPSKLYETVAALWKTVDFPKQGGGGGGLSAPDLRLNQFGFRPTTQLIEAAKRGDLTDLDAMRYLRLHLHDYQRLQSRLAAVV